ncbi:zinc finger protein [Aphelenchoides avenae]|nr:zinc finger protein [Aphelenchus avenae]
MDKPLTSVMEGQDGGAASTNPPEASQSSAASQSTQSSFVLFSATPSATQSTASQQQSEEQDDDGDMREVFCQDCTAKFPFLLVYFYHHFKGLKMPEVVTGECVYQKIRPETIETLPAGAIEFDSYKWREALCRCENCMAFYEEKQIDFLPDFEDTTYAYYKHNSEKAQANKKSSDMEIYESAMEYSGGNRDAALIAMKEWTHMKEKMAKWIEEKAQQGEVIRKEDVHAMFHELRETRLFKVPDEAMDTSAEKPPQ